MARGKDWSAEELEYLREMWGEKTIPQIAKKLGRSINAVKIKSVRLGYRSQKWCGEMMSARKVSELIGVDVHTVIDYWIPKCGLKGKKKLLGESGKCTIVYFDDLLNWLEENQGRWDSRRVEQYGLGCEYPWLVEKRKADSLIPEKRFQKWTDIEDARLIHLFKSGDYTRQELGLMLNRSASSVAHRLLRLDVWGTGKYVGEDKKESSEKTLRQNLKKECFFNAYMMPYSFGETKSPSMVTGRKILACTGTTSTVAPRSKKTAMYAPVSNGYRLNIVSAAGQHSLKGSRVRFVQGVDRRG